MKTSHTDEHEFDLALASELQAALLPTSCPTDCANQAAAARNRMCGKVGGDFYDFIRINADQTAIVIGDVVGHGVRASLLMAKIMGWLRSEPAHRSRPTEVIANLNRMLLDLGDRVGQTMLCSLFYAVIDLPSGISFFVNAGHPRPFLCDRDKCQVMPLGGQNVLLGVEPFEPVEGCHTFSPGERMVLFTDGITESQNSQGLLFGETKLHEMVSRHVAQPPSQAVELIFTAVDSFRGEAPQKDDQTLVVIDRLN